MTEDKAFLLLRAFRSGYDSVELARLFGIREAEVINGFCLARAIEKRQLIRRVN